MENKKGLSDLVATVLIVLLALAAVAIIWGFLRPAFQDTGAAANLKTQCFNIDVQPTACTYANGVATVTAVINDGDLNMVKEVIAVATVGDTVKTGGAGEGKKPSALLSSTYVDVSQLSGKPSKVTVAVIVTDGNKEQTCAESQPITCL